MEQLKYKQLWISYFIVFVVSPATTVALTTPATDPPGTDPPPTDPPGTDPPDTTVAPTTTAPTITAPTTTAPTTAAPTTAVLTTAAATTAAPTTTATPTFCNSNLNAIVGVSQQFTFLNYANDMNCYVSLTAPTSSEAVQLTASSFEIESSTYCSYDTVAVYDGSSSSATLIGEYCGTTFPSVTSSGQNLYFLFTTDSSLTYSGMTINYIAIDVSYPTCASGYTEYIATTTPQTITLASYSNLQDIYYLITANNKRAGDILVINLTFVDIEKASGCPYDRLVIYNGPCKSNGELHKICGTMPILYQLSGTSYLVHFHSDSSIVKTGFTLVYYYSASFTTPTTTTTTTIGPPVAVEINLVSEMLTNYTAADSPRRDLSTPLSSTVDAYLVGVNGLDEVSQKLTTTILFNYKWNDEQINWPVNKQGGITRLLFPQNDIWKPDFALINGFNSISEMGASFMFVAVENTGDCTWKPYQILESVCKVDMTNFPFDTQTCDLKFSTWSSSAADVTVQVGTIGIAKHESFVENSQWSLEELSKHSETLNGKGVVVFRLKIKRNPSFISFYITTPVVLLSFASAFTFALPVTSGEKSGYGITVFLSFVVYLIVTFEKMPESSETISLFAMYVLINTFMSGIGVIVVTIQIRLNGLSTKVVRMPGCLATLSRAVVRIQDKFMCNRGKGDEKFDDIQEDPGDSTDKPKWSDVSSAIDFVFFWIFMAIAILMTVSLSGYLAFQ